MSTRGHSCSVGSCFLDHTARVGLTLPLSSQHFYSIMSGGLFFVHIRHTVGCMLHLSSLKIEQAALSLSRQISVRFSWYTWESSPSMSLFLWDMRWKFDNSDPPNVETLSFFGLPPHISASDGVLRVVGAVRAQHSTLNVTLKYRLLVIKWTEFYGENLNCMIYSWSFHF